MLLVVALLLIANRQNDYQLMYLLGNRFRGEKVRSLSFPLILAKVILRRGISISYEGRVTPEFETKLTNLILTNLAAVFCYPKIFSGGLKFELTGLKYAVAWTL